MSLRAGALVLVAILGCGCGSDVLVPVRACPETRPDSPRGAVYQTALEEHCRAVGAPGCALVVARDGEPVWMGATGFADLSRSTPLCTSTPFRIASISKVYVAAVVLGLVERGRLRLDGSLGELLPDVAREIPGAEAITLEHLLAHRSGLSSPDTEDLALQLDLFDRPDELAGLGPEERFRRYVYGRALRFTPGTAFHYSWWSVWRARPSTRCSRETSPSHSAFRTLRSRLTPRRRLHAGTRARAMACSST
jgi:D-alanyl-D-alanine carboxypeptidase